MIERTTVVWPLDYAARHRNDHFIAEVLSDQLRKVAEGRPLPIYLEPSSRMPATQLSAFACEIAERVAAEINSLLTGRAIGSHRAGLRWTCILDPEERRDNDEPETGLIAHWRRPCELVAPDHLSKDLADHIRHLVKRTAAKFRGYPEARGVLLLDPYGAIRYTGDSWWARVFQNMPTPSEISEIWLATFDWVTDLDEGWIFERVHTFGGEGGGDQRTLSGALPSESQ